MRGNSAENIAGYLMSLMGDFPAPWGVAGGWAIDLFLGRVTRPHADVEIAVYRRDQLSMQAHLHGWEFDKIVDGERVAWRAGEFLELPVHEIHGRSANDLTQSIEILLNERDAENWTFRRNASVAMPLEGAIVQADSGVPILAPEIVLLYKSKSAREKDVADFLATREALGPLRRQWLRAALRMCDPGHQWLRPLDPIIIRPASPADAAHIVNIHFRAVHETAAAFYSEQIANSWSSQPNAARVSRVAAGIDDKQEMLVAEVDGTVCGFGSIVPDAEELRAVYVDPAFGRRGVGSAILLRLEALAIERGASRLSLDASLNAEAFYLKHGYAIVGRGTHRLSSGVEMACVKMTKDILHF